MTQELEAMRKAMVIRNYAEKTTSTYVAVLKKYLSHLEKPVDSVTLEDIQAVGVFSIWMLPVWAFLFGVCRIEILRVKTIVCLMKLFLVESLYNHFGIMKY